jgi:hypothetical protein
MSDPKMTMEVPPQVRDFAVKSVDQAERAISSFMESASKSVAVVPSPMNDAAVRRRMQIGNEFGGAGLRLYNLIILAFLEARSIYPRMNPRLFRTSHIAPKH